MPEGTFNLNENQGNQAADSPNPLNSGNGQAGGQIPTTPLNPTPGTDQPHQITPEELEKGQTNELPKVSPVTTPPVVNTTPTMSNPTPAENTPTPEQPKGGGKGKKYIIMAIAVIAFLAIAYVAYSFFMNDSISNGTDTEEVEKSSTGNKLGDDAKKEDDEGLEEITEELEETFGDETTGDEDAPPSLSIGGEAGSTETEETETAEVTEVTDTTNTSDTTEPAETGTDTEIEKIFR